MRPKHILALLVLVSLILWPLFAMADPAGAGEGVGAIPLPEVLPAIPYEVPWVGSVLGLVGAAYMLVRRVEVMIEKFHGCTPTLRVELQIVGATVAVTPTPEDEEALPRETTEERRGAGKRKTSGAGKD